MASRVLPTAGSPTGLPSRRLLDQNCILNQGANGIGRLLRGLGVAYRAVDLVGMIVKSLRSGRESAGHERPAGHGVTA